MDSSLSFPLTAAGEAAMEPPSSGVMDSSASSPFHLSSSAELKGSKPFEEGEESDSASERNARRFHVNPALY
jgi:hypothetical protein